MSILLDAVIRKKQTSGNLPDPAMAPRPYPELEQKKWRTTPILAIVFSLLGGILSAYFVHQLMTDSDQDTSTSKQIDTEAKPVIVVSQIPVETPINNTSKPNVTVIPDNPVIEPAELKQDSSSNQIRLAGSVVLPTAQVSPTAQSSSQTSTASRQQKTVQPVKNTVKSQPKPAKIISAKTQQNTRIIDVKKAPVVSQNKPNQQKPIILGAKSQLSAEQLKIIESNRGRKIEALPNLADNPANIEEDNLALALEAALKDVELERALSTPISPNGSGTIPEQPNDDLPKVSQLSSVVQGKIPSFHVLAHVYANNPDRRWLNVDGQELQQGDMIHGALKIVEIRPRDIVLELDGLKFKIPAF